MGAGRPADPGASPVTDRELVAVAAIVVSAAVLRFLDLPTRGIWDGDQGNDMAVLLDWVRGGVVPLLGPPTSFGDIHHGALYYWILAPAAFVSDADPFWVVATIALAGTAAVGVVWWLARTIGGPVAGIVAALLAGVSASAIEASTFIWNPNLIALSSALAFAGGWVAWRTRRAAWWLLSAAGLAATMQAHVLGVVLVVPMVGLWAADVLGREPGRRRPVLLAGLGAIAVLVVAYLPLLVSEVGSGFRETQALVDFISGRSGSADGGPNPIVAAAVIAVRVASWPLTGLLTDAPIIALAAAAGVLAVLGWLAVRGTGVARTGARWCAVVIGWSIACLAIVAPSLATVTPGLPNDHYHAFLGPVVWTVIGLGAAEAWRHPRLGRPMAGLLVAAIAGWNAATLPPPVSADGGYPAAHAAGERVLTIAGGERLAILTQPAIKNPAILAFPLQRLGASVTDRPEDLAAGPVVVVCDRLFEGLIGQPCGGPAEDALVRETRAANPAELLDRFDLSERTSVSVYR